MRVLPANTTAAPAESPTPAESPETPTAPSTQAEECVAIGHEALFREVPSSRCDICGEAIPEDETSEGYGIPGRGVYLSARGDEVRLESVPLCASCASAIGMTALARWEIEEEEG